MTIVYVGTGHIVASRAIATGYLCPVCAYDNLEHPPKDFTICPCCGTEFGMDDFATSPEELQQVRRALRYAWLDRNAPWFDPGTPRPANWNGFSQVWGSAIGFDVISTATSTGTTAPRQLPQYA